jgi:hypothetical protein
MYFLSAIIIDRDQRLIFKNKKTFSLDLGPSNSELGPPLLLSSSPHRSSVTMPRGQPAAPAVIIAMPDGGRCRRCQHTPGGGAVVISKKQCHQAPSPRDRPAAPSPRGGPAASDVAAPYRERNCASGAPCFIEL